MFSEQETQPYSMFSVAKGRTIISKKKKSVRLITVVSDMIMVIVSLNDRLALLNTVNTT